MTRWAVTGASGYIGGHVVRRLRAEGEDVSTLTRNDGDIRDVHLAERGFAGADVVVHCAAYVHRTPRTAGEVEECRSVNVDGTRAVLEAARKVGARGFIFISSSNVYGRYDRPVTEDDVCRPETPYGQAKLEAEALVRSSASAQFDPIILRPAVVIGPGAPGNYLRMASLVRRRVFPLVDGGRAFKSMLPIDTLTEAILATGRLHRQLGGSVFNVSGGMPLTMKEIASLTAEALSVRVRFLPVPGSALRVAAGIAAAVPGLRPLARMASTFTQTAALDASKLARATGVQTSEAALREAIRDAVRRNAG